MTVKISANLSETVVEALREIASKRGVSMTEVLRQAISTEKFLNDAIENDSKILIEDKDKNIKQLILR